MAEIESIKFVEINGVQHPLEADLLDGKHAIDFVAQSDLLNYYTKNQTYSQSEIQDLIDVIKQFDVVADQLTLPTATADTMRKMYLIPKENATETDNVKEEWITLESSGTYKWEKIGSTEINIEGYATEDYVEQEISNLEGTLTTAINDVADDLFDHIDDTTAHVTSAEKATWNGKQNAISNLATIESNAANGQAAYLALDGHTVGTNVPSDAKFTDTIYDDSVLAGKVSTIESKESGWDAKYSKPSTGIPSTDLDANTQLALAKANSALQEEQYKGTVTSVGVTMNGESKGIVTTSGTINLGTVLTEHQDISGKLDTNDFVAHATDTTIHTNTTEKSAWNAKYDKPSTGIPNSDLSANINQSLALADTSFQLKGEITNSSGVNGLEPGIYKVDGVSNPMFPTSSSYYGAIVQFPGNSKAQMLVAGYGDAPQFYVRRYIPGDNVWTPWIQMFDDSVTVHRVGNEYIDGTKTFTSQIAANGGVGITDWTSIKEIVGGTTLQDKLDEKQDSLLAGTGISLVNNTISASTTLAGSTTCTGVSSIPITHRVVVATVSANGVLAFAGLPDDGYEVHVIIQNTSSSTISITIPNNATYICTSETTIYIGASRYAEVNIISAGGKGYIHGISSI